MPLPSWDTFYVIVASAAAGLTGLMFVVISLIADNASVDLQNIDRQISAFSTPTIVHFGAVLLESLILTAPWPAMTGAQITVATCSAVGVVYMLVVTRRTWRSTVYTPVLEDWVFHVVLPMAAYLGVVVAVLALPRHPAPLMFVEGAAAVVLLFVGIHNAWDVVTYVVMLRGKARTDVAEK